MADRAAETLPPCPQQPAELPADSNCGFCFELAPQSLASGDSISIKASEDITPLDACPLQVNLAKNAS